MEKIVSGTKLTLLFISTLTLAFNIQPVKAVGTIYIRGDGSIDPPTAPIFSTDNITYIVLDNINEPIAVERGNIVLDGKGHTLHGTGTEAGIYTNMQNVTIKNFEITNFFDGIYFYETANNRIYDNNITNNVRYGIYLFMQPFLQTNHIIERNRIVNNIDGINHYRPIWVYDDNLTISENYIAENSNCGLWLYCSANNTIVGNTFEQNYIGFVEWCGGYSGGRIYHNNFINNDYRQLMYVAWGVTSFDDGYPSGGNYWSDYTTRYPDAKELGDSGIWDTPYVIDENNQDNYPLMEPWTSFPRSIGELATKIEELRSEGKIDNKGIVKSLIAKLDTAQKLIAKENMDEAKMVLQDFIMQVQEISGIHITVEAADILIESAEYILSHL